MPKCSCEEKYFTYEEWDCPTHGLWNRKLFDFYTNNRLKKMRELCSTGQWYQKIREGLNSL